MVVECREERWRVGREDGEGVFGGEEERESGGMGGAVEILSEGRIKTRKNLMKARKKNGE